MSHSHNARASAMSMMVVVSMVITSLIVVIAWTTGIQSENVSNITKLDQAFYAAEAGANKVAWYARNFTIDQAVQPITGTLNGYTYSATWTRLSSNLIRITSTGSNGTASYTMYMTVTPPVAAIPTFASLGDWDNKNVRVIGDVQTGGSYTNSGSGSVAGNVFYATTASNIGDVIGAYKTTNFPTVNWTTLNTNLTASPLSTLTGSQTNAVFAFTGPTSVIVVNGDVTDPTFVGSGTLYVINGSVKFTKSSITVGSAANPIHIVCRDNDITFEKAATYYGSLYTTKNLNRAQLDITGVIYVDGISPSNTGSSTFTQGNIPWFDTRANGGTGAARPLTISDFAGPTP